MGTHVNASPARNNTERERGGERERYLVIIKQITEISPNTMSWYDHSIANLHHNNTPVYFLSPRTQMLDSKIGVLQGTYIIFLFPPQNTDRRNSPQLMPRAKKKKNNIRIFHLKIDIFHIVKCIKMHRCFACIIKVLLSIHN